MPKENRKSSITKKSSLEHQITVSDTVEHLYRQKQERKAKISGRKFLQQQNDDDGNSEFESEEETESLVPAKLSRKILEQARVQLIEEEGEESLENSKNGSSSFSDSKNKKSKSVSFFTSAGDDDDDEGLDEDVDFGMDDDVELDGEYIDIRDDHLSPEDAAILRQYMPDDSQQRRTLADIIMEKLQEKEAQIAANSTKEEAEDAIDPRIVEVYTEVGKYLSTYRTGKVPKVFKVIPSLPNWEEIVFLTNPQTWTPHATNAATKIFASNFNPEKAQRFYNLILLPKCRDDIFQHKRLNFHLYLALKKAVYKPAAFYKGIILPLAGGGDCTLREALIFSSVLAKVSVPILHSAAAIIKLCTMYYTGAVSIFLRALLNKKYTLPFRVVDEVVTHFMQFTRLEGPLPLIWHRALLVFVQRYKGDLTSEQKSDITRLIDQHNHEAINKEIKRELSSAGCRGDPIVEVKAVAAAPKTQQKKKMLSGDDLGDSDMDY